MHFKDILVHIDNSEQSATRLDMAITLAKEHQAHVTGLFVITHLYYAPQKSENMARKEAQMEEMFRLKSESAQINAHFFSVDWATIGDNMAAVLNYYTHSKDLIILGQSDHRKSQDDVPLDLPELVIAGSGRPVLVVPYVGTFGTVGEHVLIAWKNGRESARSVNDAMPFLSSAKKVSVVSIETSDDSNKTAKYPDADICAHLERHGIQIREKNLVAGNIPVATLLMDYAWENGCDLIVLGVPREARKHGPVARDFLDQMTVPILMSH